MSTIVFGVRVFCGDHAAPVTPDATIGLYAVTSLLQSNAASGQKNVVLPTGHGAYFEAGEVVQIHDTSGTEENIIASIAGDTLTMQNDLANAYTTAHTAIVDADSQLRWQQNAVTGLTWGAADMLVRNGIGKLSRAVDLSYGGNTSFPGGFSFKVKNTGQLWKTLAALGIFLTGKKAEPVYFTNTTMSVLRGGICQKPEWTASYYDVQVSGDALKRNATITDEVAVTGNESTRVVVPATFGRWLDAKATMVRTVAREIFYYVGEYTGDASVGDFASLTTLIQNSCIIPPSPAVSISDPSYASQFPIIVHGTIPGLVYTVQIASSGTWDTGSHMFNPTNLYVKICSGTQNGKYRKISNVTTDYSHSGYALILTLADYFETDPLAATDGSGDWLQIVEIDRTFNLDSVPCGGFLDSDTGLTIGNGPELYSYQALQQLNTAAITLQSGEIIPALIPLEQRIAEYVRMASYGLEISSGSTILAVIQPLLSDGEIDSVKGYVIIPFTYGGQSINNALYPYNGANLSKWLGPGNGVYLRDGLYEGVDHAGHMNLISEPTWITSYNAFDKLESSEAIFSIYFSGHGGGDSTQLEYNIALELTLPLCPKLFTFEKAYLGISMYDYFAASDTVAFQSDSRSLQIRTRKFLGNPLQILTGASVNHFGNGSGVIKTLPDFYFSTSPATNNKYFFVVSTDNPAISGRTLLDLQVSDSDAYSNIYKLGICVHYDFLLLYGSNVHNQIHIGELAIIFEKSCSYSDSVYTCALGRTIGGPLSSTWGGRRTAANMIESPGDVLEAICRLENWSEYGLPPLAGWGTDYAKQAKIRTSGTGSFDASVLNDINTLQAANQILTTDDGDTEKIKKSICQSFLLCNYVDNNGFECVVPINKNPTTPSNTITLADIRYAHSEVKISEPDAMKVFPEFLVRYNKNNGSGNFDSLIRIKNVTDNLANVTTATVANYFEDTDGCFTGAEAVVQWNVAHRLWLQTGYLTEVPSAVSDLQWANGVTSQAKKIAKNYFIEMLRWMGLKTVSFAVHFMHASAGVNTRDWCEGQRFMLQLPHETDNVAVECICTKIGMNPYPPYLVDIEAVMLDTGVIPPEYYWQKVMYTAAEGADEDITASMTAQGGDNDVLSSM